MKNLKFLLNPIDYMYYRIAKAYFKWDGKSAITALLSVSLFPVLLLLSLALVIIGHIYGRPYILEHKTILSIMTISLQFILLLVFYLRYKKIGETLKIRWAKEQEPHKTIKGVIVVFALLLPFIIIITDIII